MGESAEELRRDIDRTREHMTMTVDAIEDRVMPGRIIGRKANRVRSGVGSVRDAVMGAPQQVRGFVSEGASTAADDAAGLSQRVQDRAGGNPFAAGLIAFGAGMLAATLIPPSDVEQQAALKARQAAEPLVEPLHDAAQEVVDHAKEHGQHALDTVKDSGTNAATAITDTAKTHAQQTAEHAQHPTPGQS